MKMGGQMQERLQDGKMSVIRVLQIADSDMNCDRGRSGWTVTVQNRVFRIFNAEIWPRADWSCRRRLSGGRAIRVTPRCKMM